METLRTVNPTYTEVNCNDNIPPLPIGISDAIIAPIIVYTQGYETEGQLYRVPKDEPGSNADDNGLGFNDFGGLIEGDFIWQSDGGRANGGFALSVSVPWLDKFAAEHWLGQYCSIALASGETPPTQCGIHKAFNLFGQALTSPMRCLGFAADNGSNKFFPSILLQINPDLTFQVMRVDISLNIHAEYELTLVRLGNISEERVPLNGWFAFEFTKGGAGSNQEAGFTQVNLYTTSTTVDGIESVRGINVNTGDVNIVGYAWGTDVLSAEFGIGNVINTDIPNLGKGLDNIGLDDGILYHGGGTIKRFLGDSFVGAAVPGNDGDDINSIIASDTRRNFTSNAVTVEIGASVSHGNVDRWKNVTGTPMRPRDEKLQTFGSTDSIGNPFSYCYGRLSIFTSDFVAGPFNPPYDSSQDQLNPDPPAGNPFNISIENALTRNTYIDDVGDLYQPLITRTGIATIEGLFHYARLGSRWLRGYVQKDNLNATNTVSMVSPHCPITSDNGAHRNARQVIKVGGVTLVGDIFQLPGFSAVVNIGNPPAGNPFIDTRLWRPRPGYVLGQFIENNPATSRHFTPSELPLTQFGLRSDLVEANALPDAIDHWVQIDATELGFEFAYHTAASRLVEHAVYPPIAGMTIYDPETDLDTGHVVVYDTSVDWDGTIVLRTINWGDGSGIQTFAGGGFANRLAHDYASPGSYTITVTATDNSGLVDSISGSTTITVPLPTANFDFAHGASDLTVDFTDTSTTPTTDFANTIISWHYQFGDGFVSNLQSPSHTYAIAGTYNVILTVVNSLGGTDSSTISVDVPVVVVSAGCPIFPTTPGLFVQGDDLLGGNPPLPNYADLAQFNLYYKGATFREWYDDWFGSTGDYDLDPVVTISGGRTLKQIFGATGGSKFGGGWSTVPTNDASPEVYYSSPSGIEDIWLQRQFRCDNGVMSDATKLQANNTTGLSILELFGNNQTSVYIAIRENKVLLDLRYKNAANTTITSVTVVCSDLSLFDHALITADTAGELGLRYKHDRTNNRFRVLVYAGPACGMAGASPIVDTEWITIHASNDESIWLINNWNPNFTPAGAYKNVWCIPGRNDDASVYVNPYGYTVPDLT